MKAHEKNGHMKVHEKKISHAQNIRRERQNHGTSLFSRSPLYPPHIHTHALLDHGCMTCLLFGSDL